MKVIPETCHAMHTKLDIYVFIILSVPDEGYSRNVPCRAH